MRDAVAKGSITFCSSSKLARLPSVYPIVSCLEMNPLQNHVPRSTPKKGIPSTMSMFAPQLQYLLLRMSQIVQTFYRNLIPEQRE